MKRGLTSKHTWISIVGRHEGDYMGSFKRLTILLVLFFNASAVCSLLEGQEQSIPFLTGQMSATLVAVMFSLPVPTVFGMLFGRNKPDDFIIPFGTSFHGAWACIAFLITIVTGDEIDLSGGDEGEAEAGNDNMADGQADHNAHGHYQQTGVVMAQSPGVDAKGKRRKSMVNIDVPKGDEIGYSADFRHRGNENKLIFEDDLKAIGDTPVEQGIVLGPQEDNDRKEICCGCIIYHYGKSPIKNYEYSKSDLIGVALAGVFVLGAWFIIAVLAFMAGNRTTEWVFTSVLALMEDCCVRALVLTSIEFIMFFPFCFVLFKFFPCCAWCCPCLKRYQDKNGSKDGKMFHFLVKLPTGSLGIFYKNRSITRVMPGYPAANSVKVGYVIVAVNGVWVEDDAELDKELQRAHALHTTLELAFTEPGAALEKERQDGIETTRQLAASYLASVKGPRGHRRSSTQNVSIGGHSPRFPHAELLSPMSMRGHRHSTTNASTGHDPGLLKAGLDSSSRVADSNVFSPRDTKGNEVLEANPLSPRKPSGRNQIIEGAVETYSLRRVGNRMSVTGMAKEKQGAVTYVKRPSRVAKYLNVHNDSQSSRGGSPRNMLSTSEAVGSELEKTSGSISRQSRHRTNISVSFEPSEVPNSGPDEGDKHTSPEAQNTKAVMIFPENEESSSESEPERTKGADAGISSPESKEQFEEGLLGLPEIGVPAVVEGRVLTPKEKKAKGEQQAGADTGLLGLPGEKPPVVVEPSVRSRNANIHQISSDEGKKKGDGNELLGLPKISAARRRRSRKKKRNKSNASTTAENTSV